jgi:hypothetical protein
MRIKTWHGFSPDFAADVALRMSAEKTAVASSSKSSLKAGSEGSDRGRGLSMYRGSMYRDASASDGPGAPSILL